MILGLKPVMCNVVNDTVVCKDEVYKNHTSWHRQKALLDDHIHELKQQLDSLRVST